MTEHKTVTTIARLQKDNILLASALAGITPDLRTQTKIQVEHTEDKIRAAMNRAWKMSRRIEDAKRK